VKIRGIEYWGAEEKEAEARNYPSDNWIPNTYPWLTFEEQKRRSRELIEITKDMEGDAKEQQKKTSWH